jgi:ribosomal protein S18 acetylase RimI-like enzyme
MRALLILLMASLVRSDGLHWWLVMPNWGWWQGLLETVGVVTEFQRRGVARRLILEIGKNFLQRGVTKVHLEVRDSNFAAKGLYRSLGFREVNRRPSYYIDPIEDAVAFRLELAGE